ncbi:hypothetical protein ACM614_22365 [Streptomyces sp. 12297]|uniref:hypothetical protein n=1 Tax=Streptomyces sp. NBC_00239 TaxID=2903640 RepID=UPI002E287713|nr:hypothetical protein [Streptomyces sp. NBC_00239]
MTSENSPADPPGGQSASRVPGPRTGGPADGLHTHAAALHERARRLRDSAAALDWQGPEAEAFRERVAGLADRCARAAQDLTRSAALLGRTDKN